MENKAGFITGENICIDGGMTKLMIYHGEQGWTYDDKKNYGERPEKGICSFCIRWALDQCGHLRIDTHGDNKVMQGMLKKLGFTHCGTIYVYEDNDPRLAFEKIM